MLKNFSIIDYLVLGTTFAISAGVGIFHAWKAAKKPSNEQSKCSEAESNEKTEDFLIGGRKLPLFPVSLSLMVTFVSGFSLLGVPAEIYQRGVLMWLYQMMGAFVLLICGYLFLPIFYKIRPISIYEYFELRYGSKSLRKLASCLFLLNTTFYMAVVMYAPAVAFSGITSIPTWPLILSVGLVCTFYTSLGGIKGVVWTDTIQAVFMYGGVFALIIKGNKCDYNFCSATGYMGHGCSHAFLGSLDAGGFLNVWQVASEGGRFKPLTFTDVNPAQYFSLWIAIFGGLSFWFSLYGLNQMAVQRYCSLASLRQARMVIAITAPAYVILLSLCSFIGLVTLAYFWDCDPLDSEQIDTKDQLIIYFMTKTLKSIPGLPGLFLACIFSGTLSTVSSGINSMAAVTWEDFLKRSKFTRDMTDTKATLLNKGLVCIFGMTAMALAFIAGPMGGIIQSAISMMGSIAGPLVGLFFIGVLIPSTNKYGAIIGCLISMAVCIWMTLGSVIYKPYSAYKLSMNNSQCLANLSILGKLDFDAHYGDPNVLYIYRVSSFLFALIGILLVVVLSPVISLFIKPKGGTELIVHKRSIAYTVFGNVQMNSTNMTGKMIEEKEVCSSKH